MKKFYPLIITIALISILVAFVISFSFMVANTIDQAGGPREIIVEAGKEIKSIIDDINKKEKGED